MYDTMMDPSLPQPLKPARTQDNHDVEVVGVFVNSDQSLGANHEDDNRQIYSPTREHLLIMFTCAVSSLVVSLDSTILVPILPTLAIDLHGTAAQAFWTGTSYLLTHAVVQPFVAAISEIFGRRELLIPSIVFFAIGSVVCGVANTFVVMLVGRVVQGVGGAGIITLSQLLFADLVPLRQRPKYFSIVLIAWALGSVLGPLVGGLFVERSTWRWCFWLNLPICGVALLMAIWFFKLKFESTATDFKTKLKRADWLGNFLFITSLTSFLVAISWAGIQFDWSSFQTLVPLCLGALGVLLAIMYELKLAKNPFLRHSVFNGRSAAASYTVAMIQGLEVYMALYYVSFYFSACHFFGPIRTGTSIFPATTLLLPGSAIVSGLISRTGRFRWAIWAGYATSTLATGLFVLWDDKTRTAVWAVCMCLFGLGMGMVLSSVNFSVQAVVEPEDCGQAAAMYAFMRSIGMTLGVAVGGTVFQNVMKGKLKELGVDNATEIAKHAEGFIQQLKHLSTDGAEDVLRRNVMAGYVHGFRGVWIVMTVLCGLGLLVSLLIKKGNLDAVLISKVAVEVQTEKQQEK